MLDAFLVTGQLPVSYSLHILLFLRGRYIANSVPRGQASHISSRYVGLVCQVDRLIGIDLRAPTKYINNRFCIITLALLTVIFLILVKLARPIAATIVVFLIVGVLTLLTRPPHRRSIPDGAAHPLVRELVGLCRCLVVRIIQIVID